VGNKFLGVKYWFSLKNRGNLEKCKITKLNKWASIYAELKMKGLNMYN
jgi:hypothetical protein